jgi:hypothetical protein
MAGGSIVEYLNPWRREKARQRLEAVRHRDGDNCRRCRRPMRFDLPTGHDEAPKLEQMLPGGEAAALDNLCLCHTRCNAASVDSTAEVLERLQLKATEESKARKRRKPARKAA